MTIPNIMSGVYLTDHGGPEVFRIVEQVRIDCVRIAAFAVSIGEPESQGIGQTGLPIQVSACVDLIADGTDDVGGIDDTVQVGIGQRTVEGQIPLAVFGLQAKSAVGAGPLIDQPCKWIRKTGFRSDDRFIGLLFSELLF